MKETTNSVPELEAKHVLTDEEKERIEKAIEGRDINRVGKNISSPMHVEK